MDDYGWFSAAYDAYVSKMWDEECEAHFREEAENAALEEYLQLFDDDGGERCEQCRQLSKRSVCHNCEKLNRDEEAFKARCNLPGSGIEYIEF